MSVDPRPPSRRGASGAWSRLRPSNIDPLEEYGLPSKGETRLNNPKTQQDYYNKIVDRYMTFCAKYPRGPDLEAAFASLSLAPNTTSANPSSSSTTNTTTTTTTTTTNPPSKHPTAPPHRKNPPNPSTTSPETELSTILHAMRKLRESMTATARTDAFAQRAYLFILHSTLLASAWESYLVTMLYLLERIHPATPLTQRELHEVLSYHILDLGARQDNLHEAFRVMLAAKRVHRWADARVERLLGALATDDWVRFWRLRRQVDGYQRAVLGFAEEGMRVHVLKCLGRSYLLVDREYVERCAGQSWSQLVAGGVGWELVDGEKVVVRKPKVKPAG